MLPPEPLVLDARQAHPDAQASLTGITSRLGYFQVGWHGLNVSDERGSFALVDPDGPLATYVGDVIKVVYGDRGVFAYVIGAVTGLDGDLTLTRRTYLALITPAIDLINAFVEVVVTE